ncbi:MULTISPECIES: GGDEF domain-containing protein [unclassified Anaeromyxobacter]|uniref:diguanylate cyclase n=1 Tax=unclassified Anaeromyxobacter TaxID=2620896 RepID=UPI001F584BEF|nr:MULTISPECIES: GGDEF domain-containing protein [unclassified Anaeromyxobacter]
MTADATRVRPPAPGAPASGGARLVFVEGAALLGVTVALEGEVVLGRDPGCALQLPAEDVSRRHARVAPAEAGHLVEDLGSTNGTFVNGAAVSARRLASGDRIRVGPFVARYLAAGDEAARELEALAALGRRDPLTGLANRRAFEEALAGAVARAARGEAPLALVALDVDHFKRVNDAHGHAAGDAVLAAVAARAAEALRAGDLLARIGGEEFAALLPGATLAAAAEVAERIRGRISAAPIDAGSAAIAVTVSAGLAALSRGEDGATLLARADERLYAAKRAGRDRIAR